MKKTTHINVNGQVFCIDEDAYASLQSYIETLEKHYLAEEDGIPVYWFNLEQAESLSFNAPDGTYAIAMDPWHLVSVTEEKVKLAHELGHAGHFKACNSAQSIFDTDVSTYLWKRPPR